MLPHLVPSVPEDPVDGGHGGDGGGVTHPVAQQLLPDLPGEHPRVVCLDADDPLHNGGGRNLLVIFLISLFLFVKIQATNKVPKMIK